ncbi:MULTISPECIES: hypothetical protein [Thalassospira]|uniref:Uncharacterized protein n=1 Tax=Thalassospira povalilytica TaxID=732237 RepID=A0A8I1SIM4_9PROT|nr:hypothetical protein [Thalassospira povalilytica]MBN8195924.1 hypothetical protein [Thalassospira povalilytica]MCC4241935.1 hypothetical protein [Thalassospira povalilytica]
MISYLEAGVFAVVTTLLALVAVRLFLYPPHCLRRAVRSLHQWRANTLITQIARTLAYEKLPGRINGKILLFSMIFAICTSIAHTALPFSDQISTAIMSSEPFGIRDLLIVLVAFAFMYTIPFLIGLMFTGFLSRSNVYRRQTKAQALYHLTKTGISKGEARRTFSRKLKLKITHETKDISEVKRHSVP